jgi:hypothetical protein
VAEEFTAQEVATILASLRHWQTYLPHRIDYLDRYLDIATDGSRFEPLSNNEVEELCIKLNFGE